MVDRKDPLPVTQQCALLDLPRSTFCHVPKPASDDELELMALIDRCHLKHPFYGSRRLRDWLEDQGYWVNRKRVRRLMRTMDLTARCPKRNLSLANQAHKVYPYLLRGRVIDRPNQVWAADVTYSAPRLRRLRRGSCRGLSMSGMHTSEVRRTDRRMCAVCYGTA